LVHAIPLASYEGFVVFKTIKHTPKSLPVGIYEGFGGSKWTKITPGGHPIALCLGLAKTAQTLEHLEHLRPLTKKVFEGVFRSGICRKRTTLEHLERSGEFKGVKEEGKVLEGTGGGGSGKVKGLRYKARYGHRSVRNKETRMLQDLVTHTYTPLPLNRGYGGIGRCSSLEDDHTPWHVTFGTTVFVIV
jgi:hypothetical protein